MDFWKTKKLEQLSDQEWESLCDGCGKCCLEKLVFEDDTLAFTNVACCQLNLKTCRCKHYADRTKYVPECVQITAKDLKDIYWLPKTCAYRLLYEGKPLPDWHPLISKDPNSVHVAKMSTQGRSIKATTEDKFIDHIVEWTDL